MCTSPHRVFKTGLKTDTGKDLLYFDNHYPCPDRVSLDLVCKALKRRIPFDARYMHEENGHIFLDVYLDVPCGKCDACQLQHARNWANRVLMEAYYSPYNYFVTLTFDDAFCPGKVDSKDITAFMKRLRAELGQDGIKFFACGEYGEKSGRPHYHIILLDCRLDDLRLLDANKKLFVSDAIAKCWPFGFHSVADCTVETINYVARYTSKKTSARKGFLQMSRRPGLGCRYLLSHPNAYKLDYIPLLVDGRIRRITPPRYYEKLFPDLPWMEIKGRRLLNVQAQTRLQCFIHGLFPERLDHYNRECIYKAKRERLQKHEL